MKLIPSTPWTPLKFLMFIVVIFIGITLSVASLRPLGDPVCRVLLGFGLSVRSVSLIWGTAVAGLAISIIYGSWFMVESIRKRRK